MRTNSPIRPDLPAYFANFHRFKWARHRINYKDGDEVLNIVKIRGGALRDSGGIL